MSDKNIENIAAASIFFENAMPDKSFKSAETEQLNTVFQNRIKKFIAKCITASEYAKISKLLKFAGNIDDLKFFDKNYLSVEENKEFLPKKNTYDSKIVRALSACVLPVKEHVIACSGNIMSAVEAKVPQNLLNIFSKNTVQAPKTQTKIPTSENVLNINNHRISYSDKSDASRNASILQGLLSFFDMKENYELSRNVIRNIFPNETQTNENGFVCDGVERQLYEKIQIFAPFGKNECLSNADIAGASQMQTVMLSNNKSPQSVNSAVEQTEQSAVNNTPPMNFNSGAFSFNIYGNKPKEIAEEVKGRIIQVFDDFARLRGYEK